MSMKWDIADDVVAYDPTVAKASARPKRRKAAILAAAAVLTTAVSVGGAALASQSPTVWMVSYGSSRSVPISESFRFVRPRGVRTAVHNEVADVQVGMSTRRLGELHRKLFVTDKESEEELVGDYSFL
jgi:hypothetical protein